MEIKALALGTWAVRYMGGVAGRHRGRVITVGDFTLYFVSVVPRTISSRFSRIHSPLGHLSQGNTPRMTYRDEKAPFNSILEST